MKEPIFEVQSDRERELKAISHFCSLFDYEFKKLDQFNIDFEITENKIPIIYAEVKGRNYNIFEGNNFAVAIKKINKLAQHKNPVLVWACYDGIVFGQLKNLEGIVKWGGRKIKREKSITDQELMAYYPKQQTLNYSYFDSNKFEKII